MLLTEASLGNVSRDIEEIRYLMSLVNKGKECLSKPRIEKLRFLQLLKRAFDTQIGEFKKIDQEVHPTLSDSTIDNWLVSYITDNMSMVDLKVMAFRASYGFEFEPQYLEIMQPQSQRLEYE